VYPETRLEKSISAVSVFLLSYLFSAQFSFQYVSIRTTVTLYNLI
jgi:hypothetical protein